MSDKPILFSGPMVRALLAGTKTQTRRVLTPQPTADQIKRWGAVSVMTRIAVGDRLYVREAWRADSQVDVVPLRDMSPGEPILYEADGVVRSTGCSMIEAGRLRPGINMPRWASRLTLTVTDVRVQRLLDISEEDAIAEGVPVTYPHGAAIHSPVPGLFQSPTYAYRTIWESINGPGSWEANPWVVAYTFTVEHGNIDQIGAAA